MPTAAAKTATCTWSTDTNNMFFGAGGPIWSKHKFFFASLQPYPQSTSAPGLVFNEDPAFVALAQSRCPTARARPLHQEAGHGSHVH